MLSVIAWLWKPAPGYRSQFNGKHVNTLRAMVARNYAKPHRFICCTDIPAGIAPDIEIVPLWNDYANVQSPHGHGNPSCYRRLKAFSPEAEAMFGPRFVSLDLDTVIVGDLSPLWDRDDDFVICGDTAKRTPYNGSMFMLRAGTRQKAWKEFDPVRSPALARKQGYIGSDQAWLGVCLGPNEKKWTAADGVYSYRNQISRNGGHLPKDARVVIFHGQIDPDHPVAQRHDWVRSHYR